MCGANDKIDIVPYRNKWLSKLIFINNLTYYLSNFF